MRALIVLCAIAGCGGGPAYKVAVTEAYEVGEDVTVSVRIREPKAPDDEETSGKVVLTRPDGTTVEVAAPLDVKTSRVRLGTPVLRPGTPPTINATGAYQLELRDGPKVLAKSALDIKINHLDELLPDEEVADYKPISRFTRAKQLGKKLWKTYGAIYEHSFRAGVRTEILIEEPKAHLADAWKPYEEEGVLSVIEDNNVRFRERSDGTVTASWISDKKIVAMRAPTLADLERGVIAHFLAKFPSKLKK